MGILEPANEFVEILDTTGVNVGLGFFDQPRKFAFGNFLSDFTRVNQHDFGFAVLREEDGFAVAAQSSEHCVGAFAQIVDWANMVCRGWHRL